MDREILFRGKSLDFGDWLCGYIRQYENGKITICDFEKNRLWFVDPSTVGQFTGLIDKNGTKIFEGDILHFWSEYTESYLGKCVVKYGKFNCSCCNGVFGWYLEGGDIRDLEGNSIIKYEICGNIHDNPELLEGGVENAAD